MEALLGNMPPEPPEIATENPELLFYETVAMKRDREKAEQTAVRTWTYEDEWERKPLWAQLDTEKMRANKKYGMGDVEWTDRLQVLDVNGEDMLDEETRELRREIEEHFFPITWTLLEEEKTESECERDF